MDGADGLLVMFGVLTDYVLTPWMVLIGLFVMFGVLTDYVLTPWVVLMGCL